MEDYEKEFEDKKILITGGLGFIGSNLARRLLEFNPSRMILIDCLLKECGGNEYNVQGIEKQVNSLSLDIRDEKSIEGTIVGLKPDYIFSLAGLLSHTESLKNPKNDEEINCLAQYNLLEPCRKTGQDIKILYAGTRGQYGKTKINPITEKNSILRPADPNGISKNSGEQACLFYGDNFENINAVSLRMTNTYGPRHQMRSSEQGVLNWFIRLAMSNQDITVYKPGTQLRDFNYIDDVVDALLIAMSSKKTNGEVYNLGSCYKENNQVHELCGNIISVKDVSKKVVDISKEIAKTKGNFDLIPYPSERKKIEVGDIKMDFTKFNKATGWKPKVNLEDGLRKTIEFYLKNKKNYW